MFTVRYIVEVRNSNGCANPPLHHTLLLSQFGAVLSGFHYVLILKFLSHDYGKLGHCKY
jgi:hypothetical protein